MRIRALLCLSVLLLASCSASRQEEAAARLIEAVSLRDSGNFNLAKLKLDTLIRDFKDVSEEYEKAKLLLLEISRDEQMRNLNFLDSALIAQEALLEPLMKNFILSDEYGAAKLLIHKRQKPENSYNRTFLRAHLNQEGDFYISSRYHGTRWINHQQIKVYYDDQSVLSEIVPEDGLNNRRFEDGEYKWEFVNYKDGKDNGIVDFIASNADKPLRVQLIGKSHEYIIMEQFDREAIRDAYEISFIQKEINRIRDEKKRIETSLNRLEQDSL
ncbi:MAG TPA: hypothetical protein DEG09_05245 [Marinilabiliaceae bacterium]|nr:hypothetical protein [Marinilabiliaceae bacterium]HBX88007.1 hypothetical protein [Marinilabiliaceae bacterium]